MFPSRLLKRNPSFCSKLTYRFAEFTNKTNDQLSKKIRQSTTWKDFIQVFQRNKREFNAQILHTNCAQITDLLSKNTESISFKSMSELWQIIIKLDIPSIRQQEIISLLQILRSTLMKGFNQSADQSFRMNLLERYNSLQLRKPELSENITKMMHDYQLFNYLGQYACCQSIAKVLCKLIENQNSFTKEQKILILKCLAHKQDLNTPEKKVRCYLLQSIAMKTDQLSVSELAQCLNYVYSMDLDFSYLDVKYIKVMIERLLQNKSKLDYEILLKLLQPETQNSFIFSKIYEEIYDYLFEKISNDGRTKIDKIKILALLKKISSRYNFYQISETNKIKVYKFFTCYVKQLIIKKDVNQIQQFMNTLRQMINKKFIYCEQPKFLNFLELLIGLPVNISLLFLLQIKKVDISRFFQKLLKLNLKKLDVQMIELAVLLNMVSKKQKYQSYKQHLDKYMTLLQKIINQAFTDQQCFTQVFNDILHSFPHPEIIFRQFNSQYGNCFKNLVNPFEIDEQKTSNLYKLVYCQYVTIAFHQKEMLIFFQTYQPKIKPWIIVKVINKQCSQNTPRKNILRLCMYQLNILHQHKHKGIVQEIIFVASKYNRFVLFDLDRIIPTLVFNIIHRLFDNIEILQEINLEHYFFYKIEKYFTRNNKNYHNEYPYRQLLTRSLQILPRFKSYQPSYLIREGLRLNLLTKQLVQSIDLAKAGLIFHEKCMLEYLKNSQFVPIITKINFNILVVLFHNPNMSGQIIKNRIEIIKEIKKSHSDQLFQYLTIFNQPRIPQSRQIIVIILQTLVGRGQSIEKSDFVGALSNLLQKDYYFYEVCRKLIQKVVEHIQRRLHQYYLQTHQIVIKFVISQKGFQPLSYYLKLLQYYQKNKNQKNYLNFLQILCHTNFKFNQKHCKYIKTLLKSNTQGGLSLFFSTQSLIPTEQMRQEILSEILDQTKKINVKSLSKLQYDYLKETYPENTKGLSKSDEQLSKHVFSLRPLPTTISLLEQLALAHKANIQVMREWGQKNYIVKIKSWVFFFSHPKRQEAWNERNFIKRGLKSYFQKKNSQIITIQLSVGKANSLAMFLKKNYPELLTESIYAKLVAQKHINPRRQQQQDQPSSSQLKKKKYSQQIKWRIKIK